MTGKSIVILMPTEFNGAGKRLPSYYEVGGGKGGTYALLRPADKQAGRDACVISYRRLKIVSVAALRVGDICDADVRLAGFRDIPEFIEYATTLYGHLPFEGQVWRYEFEAVTSK